MAAPHLAEGKFQQSKPALDAMISQAQLQEKVDDYLHKSQLVAEEERGPITPQTTFSAKSIAWPA